MRSTTKKTLLSSLLIFITAAVGIAAFQHCLPEKTSPSFRLHVSQFYAWSLFLVFALLGVGKFLRLSVFRTERAELDLPLGFGSFALLLVIYLKLTLNPYFPLLILLAGFLYRAQGFFAEWNQKDWDVSYGSVISLLVLILCTVSLSFAPPLHGFLYLPIDFDSDLFHLSFPAQVVLQGKYFIPYLSRAPWHPQLTHHWYMFILSWMEITFIKSINFVVWIELVILFSGNNRVRAVPAGALALAVMCAVPEFHKNLPNTSLDAVLALFEVSAFVFFCRIVQSPKWNELALLTVICGFAAGQKHFGLMFAAVLLPLASLRWLQVEILRKPGSQAGLVKKSLSAIPPVTKLVVLFIAVFLPFYAHNLFTGNSLLFPFTGGSNNTYGWTSADLTELLTQTIPHWGHSHSLGGFFLLPAHLINHPLSYQFFYSGSPYDWAISVIICFLFLALPLVLIVKRWRKPQYVWPILVLLADLLLWYRGSQVIRYLFPLMICGFYLVLHMLLPLSEPRPSIKKGVVLMLSILALIQSIALLRPAIFPIPVSKVEREDWLKTYATPRVSAYQFLRERVRPGERVLGIFNITGLAYFPELKVCGDNFAACRFTKFVDRNLNFKEWTNLQPEIRAHNLAHLVVQWNVFRTRTRPASFNGAFPQSTASCLEHVFFDGEATDVFEIKQECR